MDPENRIRHRRDSAASSRGAALHDSTREAGGLLAALATLAVGASLLLVWAMRLGAWP